MIDKHRQLNMKAAKAEHAETLKMRALYLLVGHSQPSSPTKLQQQGVHTQRWKKQRANISRIREH